MLTALTLLSLTAGPAAPKAERLDALDFDNGAILVSESGSYGSEVGGWSAWNLADGDPLLGWCSADGAPTGGTFVWDLDTTWQLDTFVISTENVQEDGYPGISANTVDLFVSEREGAAFTKVGSFNVGRLAKASSPLKGIKAKQVKLVVTSNHGNAQYTEIAEVDLLGSRLGTVPPIQLGGDFATNYGALKIIQDGTSIYGCYDYAAKSSLIWGSVEGRIARVTWQEDNAESGVREGTATFAVRADGQLWGVWYEHGQLAGLWTGPKSDTPPVCTPQKRGTLSRLLKTSGRAVLYGIHFASASDVPLTNSGPALEELVAAMKEDPSVRLLIEGHTDSTNTDAFNLDLSQRRSKAVVDWLTKHGVDPKRLEAKGFGRARPVADNASAQGRALNRRVEVSVLR